MSEPFDVGDLFEEAWLNSSYEANDANLQRGWILEALILPAHALRTVPTDSVEPQGASIHYLWIHGRPVGLQHVKRLSNGSHLYRVTTSPGCDLITLGGDVGVAQNRATVHRAAMRGRSAEHVPPPVARRLEPKSAESPRRRSSMEEQIADVMGSRMSRQTEDAPIRTPASPQMSYSLTRLSFHIATDDHGLDNVDQATRAWVGQELGVGGRKLGKVVGLSWSVDGSELRLDIELLDDCAAVVPLPTRTPTDDRRFSALEDVLARTFKRGLVQEMAHLLESKLLREEQAAERDQERAHPSIFSGPMCSKPHPRHEHWRCTQQEGHDGACSVSLTTSWECQ